MSIDNSFRRGSKGSSAILDGELTSEQVEQFMRTSFYLPVDILQHPDWQVKPIHVMTGKEFYNLCYNQTAYCVEDQRLLCSANLVAVSVRRNKKTGERHQVAKIWYGSEARK